MRFPAPELDNCEEIFEVQQADADVVLLTIRWSGLQTQPHPLPLVLYRAAWRFFDATDLLRDIERRPPDA